MRLRWLILLGAAALAGCVSDGDRSSGTSPEAASPYNLLPADVVAVRQGVVSSLKDPNSAMFGEMRASGAGNAITVCGYVNAKNSFGGYSGNVPYIGVLGTNMAGQRVFGLSAMGGESTYASQAVMILCSRRGAAI